MFVLSCLHLVCGLISLHAEHELRRPCDFGAWTRTIPILLLGGFQEPCCDPLVCYSAILFTFPLGDIWHCRPTVIVGLFLQQAIALFVLKSGAGFSIFHWIATLASDFLNQALVGAAFFFNQDVVNMHFFFVNTVC